MGRENLIGFFHDYFDSPAEYLVYDDGYRRWTYSYKQSANAARLFFDRLRHDGIGKGERIVIWSEARPEGVFAFWGALLAGAVVVPIGGESSPDFVRRVVEHVKPRMLALGDEIRLDDRDYGIPALRLTAENWKGQVAAVEPAELIQSDLAEIVFTSGSTGDPSGVQITHGNVLSQVESVESIVKRCRWLAKLFSPLRFLQLLPLSHMFGQITTFGLCPMIPSSVVIMRQQSPGAIVEQIRERRIAGAICVPRFLELLRSRITASVPEANAASTDKGFIPQPLWRYRRVRKLLGWKFLGFLVGGAALSGELEDFWSGLGYLVTQGYGLTETSPVVTLTNPLRPRRGSPGKALPGVQVRIAPDGEILVRGPNVTPGYYEDRERTERALAGEWLHTGDLGELDRDGYLYIRGRKKEVIVTPEGLNILPEDIEGVLDAQNGMRESAVIGMAPEKDGAQEEVHAVLLLQNNADPRQVIESANRQLEEYQRIRNFSVWHEDTLPRTEGTGKLKRGAIRDRLLADRRNSPKEQIQPGKATDCGPELVETEIRQRTGRSVTAETRLDELGLSSVDKIELLLEFENRCQITVNESEFARAETVGDLKTTMERMLAGANHSVPFRAGPIEFPAWTRNWLASAVRRLGLAFGILPFTRLLTRPMVKGLEYLETVEPPVIFAANHESNLDAPVILAALPANWRYRIAPAMYKERFRPHFFPKEYGIDKRLTSSFQYYLVTLFFNTFPIPQEEPGARQTLRYAGDLVSDNWSLLIFPEGERRPTEAMGKFLPGVGLLASRLKVPVIPVHLEGIDRVLPRDRAVPRPGAVRIQFGAPLALVGPEPEPLADRVEQAVKSL